MSDPLARAGWRRVPRGDLWCDLCGRAIGGQVQLGAHGRPYNLSRTRLLFRRVLLETPATLREMSGAERDRVMTPTGISEAQPSESGSFDHGEVPLLCADARLRQVQMNDAWGALTGGSADWIDA